jgi:hypothetical protein
MPPFGYHSPFYLGNNAALMVPVCLTWWNNRSDLLAHIERQGYNPSDTAAYAKSRIIVTNAPVGSTSTVTRQKC